MNLSDWARQAGMSRYAACRWYHAGTLRVPARGAGQLILVRPGDLPAEPGRTVIYARVSSAGQRAGLDRRVARLTSWVTASGMSVGEVVTEVGSAMSGRCGARNRVLRAVSCAGSVGSTGV